MSALPTYIPSNEKEALHWLLPILDEPAQQLPADAFKQAWSAVFYLYAGLHPDGAVNHGTEVDHVFDGPERFRDIEPKLVAPSYVESGWPLVLEPLAAEAWRRYEAGILHDEEMYPADAQYAGLKDRMNG